MPKFKTNNLFTVSLLFFLKKVFKSKVITIFIYYASFETKENIVKFNSSKTNIKSKKLNMY